MTEPDEGLSEWYHDEDRLIRELRDAHSSELPTPDLADYRDLREIGRGGQGRVYRGRQRSTGQTVAIKVLREPPDCEDRGRFHREMESMTRLTHPAIVKALDGGETADGRPYLVMDLIDGVPFDEFARRESLRAIASCTAAVADAIQHAHQRGVIHRDLKPGNIRVDATGQPHILDFGMAKILGETRAHDLMSRTGLFLGSLPWASPEQLGSDAGNVDARTDIYALGVLLYEACCGSPPYPNTGGIRETIQHVTATRPSTPRRDGRTLPSDLAVIVMHCLEKDPARRYQAASELAQDLRRYLAHEPISARPPRLAYMTKTWVRRNRSLSVLAAILILGTLTGGAALWSLYERSLRAESDARLAADKFEAVNEYLLGSILSTPQDGAQTVETAVRKAAAGIDDAGLTDPMFRAETHNAVAYWLSSLDDKVAAKNHHEEAMRLRLSVLDPKSPELSEHYRTLAYFREKAGDFTGAIELMKRALDNMAEESAPRQSTLAWVHRVIGRCRLALGERAMAAEAVRRSLAIEQVIRQPDAKEILECRSLLAEIEKAR